MKCQKINISFDIEDIYGDQNLLNKMLFDLLVFCNNNRICIDAYISAIKLPFLSEDIIKLLKKSKYINPGYHSNSHSFLIIPEQNSMEELIRSEEFFFDLKTKKLTNEKGGIFSYLNHFSPTSFRCPGYCWTPDYFELMNMYGFRATTIDIDYPNVFLYKGIAVIPTQIKALEKIYNTEELSFSLQNSSVKSVYLHPARLVYNHFWDKMKNNSYHIVTERNIYSDMNERISLIKKLFLFLRDNYTLFSASDIEIQQIISDTNELNLLRTKLRESMFSKWRWSQILMPINKEYHLNKLETNTLFIGKIKEV